MKNHKFSRSVTLFLAFCMILSMLPQTFPIVHAEESKQQDAQTAAPQEQISTQEQQFETFMEIDAASVPEIIGLESARAQKHIFRLSVDEANDLNKVVFQNLDGTKTMYLFGFPVKYVDSAGEIQDISLEIADGTSAESKFQTKSNSIITQFPEKMSTGIRLQGNGVDVTLIPSAPLSAQKETHTVSRIDAKTVSYGYDSKTSIEYSLTYTGFKEDIVVSEYTGQTEYTFTLRTNGLSLTQIDGSYYLTDAAGEIRGTLGDIIVFTADERNNTLGRMEAETVTANQEYRLTIILDAQYLANPNTAYPIRIDPTIEINYDQNGSGAIADITVSPTKTFSGTGTSLYIGKHGTHGLCRALMQFPQLDLSTFAFPSSVTSAEVQIRDLMCESTSMTLECHNYNGASWSESSGATYHSAGYNSPISSQAISYSIGNAKTTKHRYSFDITVAVRRWISDPATKAKGILFKAANSVENGSATESRTFAAYNRASYKPSLKVTYNTSISINTLGVSLEDDSTYQLTATTTPAGKTVTWTSANSQIATVNRTTGLVTAVNPGTAAITATMTDDEGNPHTATCTVHVHLATGYYKVRSYGSDFYMGVNNGSIVDYTSAILQTSASVTATDQNPLGNLTQVWKITYINNGYYSIRPVYWEQLALYAKSGTDVCVYRANTTSDTLNSMNAYALWTVDYSGTGFTIGNRGNSKCLHVVGGTRAAGKELELANYSSTDTTFRWTFAKITASSPMTTKVLLYDVEERRELPANSTIYLNLYETKSLSDLGLAVQVCSGDSTDQVVSLSSDDSTVASINSSTRRITGNARGKTTIHGSRQLNAVRYSVHFDVIVEQHVYVKNFYDSTLNDADDEALRGYIEDAVEFLNIVYENKFYFKFHMDGPAVKLDDAPVDECPVEDSSQHPCNNSTCGEDCSNHHKNLKRIANELYQYHNPGQLIVMWSDSDKFVFCKEDSNNNNAHTPVPSLAIVVKDENLRALPVIQMLNISHAENSNYSKLALMSLVLAHEVAHTLGLPEQTGGTNNTSYWHDNRIGEDGKSYYCFMTLYKGDYFDGLYNMILAQPGSMNGLCQSCNDYLKTTSGIYDEVFMR